MWRSRPRGRAADTCGVDGVGDVVLDEDDDQVDGTCPAGLPARGDGKCVGQNVDDTRDVLTTSGGFAVWGSLAVDGNGCMKVGSNGLQVRFDANVFDSAQSYGTVGLVQNTWRELSPKDA